jgi:3-methyl-2-oxobutanoate hydroxymethyltransferase
MADRITAPKLRLMKERGQSIVCVTAYDVFFAQAADEAGIDVILVGDSLGNVVLGYETTVPVEMADVLHHLRAVRRGVTRAHLVADLPFGSYHVSTEQAIENAILLMKAGADAVKLEGDYPDTIRAMTKAGIPVWGHVGFTPQAVNTFGGFKVQGRGDAGSAVFAEAQSIDAAGVCAIVLELIPAALSAQITQSVASPTIGIGGGIECDGQIQVMHDILGLTNKIHKHAKPYIDGRSLVLDAFKAYTQEVRERKFPTEENSF